MWVKHSFIFTVTLNNHYSCKRSERCTDKYTPGRVSSVSCMALIIQSCPLAPSAGLRWKVSLMAPTSSVTLTKPLCCRGKSSPKHLWEERKEDI